MATTNRVSLTFRTANLYVGGLRKAARTKRVIAGKPHAVAIQEGHGRWPGVLAKIEGYQYLAARSGGKNYADSALLIRRDVKVEHWYTVVGSHTVPGDKFGHERRIVVARCVMPNGYRFVAISTHINAVLVGLDGKVLNRERVVRAQRHMRLLAETIRTERKAWGPVVWGMDSNYPLRHGQKVADTAEWSPYRLLCTGALSYDWHGIDGIGVSGFEASDLDVTPREKTGGADHPWLTARINALPTREA